MNKSPVVCSGVERHKKLHGGGKKHPLMIKLKVALVISRAFGSLGVNMALTIELCRFTQNRRAVVIRGKLF